MIRFACPKCGKLFNVADDKAGGGPRQENLREIAT
jgi:hypothetical protein